MVGESVYGRANWAGLGYSVIIDQFGVTVGASYENDQDGGPGVIIYGVLNAGGDVGYPEVVTPFPSPSPSATPSRSPSESPSTSLLPSASPSISSVPSASPSSSSQPSTHPSSVYDREFQIRSNYDGYNSAFPWCAGPEKIEIGALIKNRPCDYVNSARTQIWRRDEGGQIKLSRIQDDLCLMKTGSRRITLDTCEETFDVSEVRKFTLGDNEHTLTMVKNKNTFLVGFEVDRIYSRLRLYEQGSLNDSLKKWETKYGPNFD